MTTPTRKSVSVTERTEMIPTYEIGEPGLHPLFLEKRVYQGSSGVVYPHPVVEAVSDTKTDKPYRAVYLENDYIKVMVLPELGGRIQMAYDKIQDYHFVYFNRVVKPALVGLTGPWISGGIEFNWPQHHRPSTFDPVQYRIERRDDGSATVWVGEVEKMFNTFGSAGITLHPDRAVIQIEGRLYNPTPTSQTFLWWANPAVSVNDEYQAVFPPDVHAVFDHGKRDVSEFPVAKGSYYKVDYSRGVDISWYKNVPVPTSYMAYHSDFDFVGGYDHGKAAGLLHVADHRVSPGKKMWTWGNGAFSRAWERHLTDGDGPYIELMTGVFTDNQPDFCWIMSGERKEFTQYFLPYGGIEKVSCATERMVLGVEARGDRLAVALYSPEARTVKVRVVGPDGSVQEESLSFAVGQREELFFAVAEGAGAEAYRVLILGETGETLLDYREGEKKGRPVPASAVAPLEPEDIPTVEELYFVGTHLEQYRHATRDPEAYYKEALSRDGGDTRCNCAMGWRALKAGDFVRGEGYFRAALARATRLNPNPPDAEPYRGLGLCLFYLDRIEEAQELFARCAWNGRDSAWAWYWTAVSLLRLGRPEEALRDAEKSLNRDASFLQALILKATALRRRGEFVAAREAADRAIMAAPLYFHAHAEAYFIAAAGGSVSDGEEWRRLWEEVLDRNAHTLLEIAFEYRKTGDVEDALALVRMASGALEREPAAQSRGALPLLSYAAAWFEHLLGKDEESRRSYAKAEEADFRYCFPNKTEYLAVFDHARRTAEGSARAAYYQGCLLYGKRRYEDAHRAWEASAERDGAFSPVHRNLAISFFNKKGLPERAESSLLRAIETAPEDGRIAAEFSTLQKRTRTLPEERRAFFEERLGLVASRDDLVLEYATVLNILGRPREALEAIRSRTFHPWEGGEGSVSSQYRASLVSLAREALLRGEADDAVGFLTDALDFPENLGENRLPNTPDNEIRFYLGFCASLRGDAEGAAREYGLALTGPREPSLSFFYNDTPADALFYRALALRMLGRPEEAEGVLASLLSYAETHKDDEIEVDFFAVSLPELQVFDENLDEKNFVFCSYIAGLGLLGMGKVDAALAAFSEAAAVDPSHWGTASHIRLVKSGLWDSIRGRLGL